MQFSHLPVMLDECIDALNIKPDGLYVDCTPLIHVLQDILLYRFGMGHNANIASITNRYESMPNPPITPTQAPVMSEVWR